MGSDDSHRRRLRVDVTDYWGRPFCAAGLGRWLARIAPARARGVVTVAFVGDARSRALNRRFRGKDAPTDVLSFPAKRDGGVFPGVPREKHPRPFLGEIVIARGVARRQARLAGHREADEHRILALHGLLHLLGYDHERDHGQMARLEKKLRKKGGLAVSLTER